MEGDDTTDLPAIRRAVETLWNAADIRSLDPSTIAEDLREMGIPCDPRQWEWATRA